MVDVALYGHWICPFVTRVQFALHQRGIAHELIDLPPSAVRGPDFELPPEFVEHSPRLEVPLLRIGDEFLADSIPILERLETAVEGQPLLPAEPNTRALVRDRMAWIDHNAYRPMGGVYYNADPVRIERAGAKLADALSELGGWASASGWLAGATPSLAEAVAIPIHVRLRGLQRLGFHHEVSSDFVAHGERCRELDGWPAIAWSAQQTNEFVGRFEAHRRRQQ